jgi:hypothetical protein
LAAGLVLKYGIGTRVSLESEFTLLIPSDEAIGALPLATWTKLNEPKSDAFEKWYHKHHSDKRIAQKDVVGDAPTTPVKELRVDDATSHALVVDEGGFKIDNVPVLIADVGTRESSICSMGIFHRRFSMRSLPPRISPNHRASCATGEAAQLVATASQSSR